MITKYIKDYPPLLNRETGEVRIVKERLTNGTVRCHQTSADGIMKEVFPALRKDFGFEDAHWMLKEPAGHLLEGWKIAHDEDGFPELKRVETCSGQ